MEKKDQREFARGKLKQISETQSIEAGEKVLDTLKERGYYKEAKTVFCYLSAPSELDTIAIVKDAIKSGKEVYVPRIEGEDMSAVIIDTDTEFWFNKWGILEPKSGGAYKGDFDLTLVPLVAYDKGLNRLGHGKGYYDKFLAGRGTKKVGLAFSCQELETLITDSHDVKLDAVINEIEEIAGE